MGRLAGRIAAGQRHHARHRLGGNRRLAGLARLVAQQPFRAFLSKPLLSAPDHRTADAEGAGRVLHCPPFSRCEHHLCPLHVLAGAVPIRDDRRKALAIRRAEQNANRLCHGTRLAQTPDNVNRQNASEH